MKKIAIHYCDSTDICAKACETALKSNLSEVELYLNNAEQFETDVKQKKFAAVVDLSLADLAKPISAFQQNRLTAAAIAGIPQIISVGGLQNCTAEQLDLIGKMIVERVSASAVAAKIVLPMRGIQAGEQLSTPMSTLYQSIQNWVYPPSLLEELPLQLNEATFGEECAKLLLKLLKQ